MEIFYWYDINLENNNGLDFGNQLEKLLVLVKRRKYWVDFIQDKESDLVNKYESLEKVLIARKIVESFINLTPPIRFQTVQRAVQEDILVVRIYISQIREARTSKVSLGANDCMLTFDLAKNCYKDLVTLFPDLKPGNKKVRQLHVDSVTIVKLFDNTIYLKRYTHTSDNSSKRIS